MKKWALLVIIFVFVAGCIKPVQQLGCCLREPATEGNPPGCMLYNLTTFEAEEKYLELTFLCENESGEHIPNHCLVYIGEEWELVPICTEDQLVACIEPDCTAMVCGDFKYQPRATPGFVSIEESEGEIPPDSEEKAAMNFYQAQCRFFPMDAQLRQIMKNSRSQINVFRMGLGGSFDEFDQYRYYFPMSDKFCNLNPPKNPGDLRVDRYMNYLGWEGGKPVAYDAVEIDENCFDNDNPAKPFTFQESEAKRQTTINLTKQGRERSTFEQETEFAYFPVVPDMWNYKFSHYGRVDRNITAGGTTYRYGLDYIDQFSVYKKIDEEFYKKELSIAHADKIYGISDPTSTRAPFECDLAASECYSGNCNTRAYSRSVLLTGDGTGEEATEVITDCNEIMDEFGNRMIYCAPTKSVSASGGTKPNIQSVEVSIVPAHAAVLRDYYFSYSLLSSVDDDRPVRHKIESYWDYFARPDYEDGFYGLNLSDPTTMPTGSLYSVKDMTNTAENVTFEQVKVVDCPDYCIPGADCEENPDSLITADKDPDEIVYCPKINESSKAPPAAGAVFFGKFGQDEVVSPGLAPGQIVIGYALADTGDIQDMYIVKHCNLVDGKDYRGVSMTYLPGWQGMMDTFKPYFEQRVQNIMAGGFSDGCGGGINAMDIVVSSMPWVINYEKGKVSGSGDNVVLSPEAFYLSSPIAQQLIKSNTYDEEMVDTPGTSSCELRRSTILTFGSGNYYNLAVSEYIWLFIYQKGSGKLGTCAIDDSSYLPKTKTYGWCEPCTTSTLAFQEITAYERPYMPERYANIEGEEATDISDICEVKMESTMEYVPSEIPGVLPVGRMVTKDQVSCFNEHITDIDDYKGSFGDKGTPRTIPEASVLKERMGNYMKSGILPVIDMSDDSNWAMEHPDALPDYDIYWIVIGSSNEDAGYASDDYSGRYHISSVFAGESVVLSTHMLFENQVGSLGFHKLRVESAATRNPYGHGLETTGATFGYGKFPWLFGSYGAYAVIVYGMEGEPRDLRDNLQAYLSDGDELFWWHDEVGAADEYLDYDFEALFGEMGSTVAIVEHVSGKSDAETKMDDIIDRAIELKQNCFGCLAAFHVDNPEDNESFRETIEPIVTNPTGQLAIDLITFDYQTSEHFDSVVEGKVVAEDIASYGRISLTTPSSGGKPVMVVGLNTKSGDPWDHTNYDELFDGIVTNQGELIKAGVIGIIYAPARDRAPDNKGVVDVGGAGSGIKISKFCALQGAMQKMSETPPTALITKILARDSVTCESCSSLEIVQGLCDVRCDNGVECKLPEGVSPADKNVYKCPANTVVDECQLCQNIAGSYECTFYYGNGTEKTVSEPMSVVSSDAYKDVVAGLSKPEKCCLADISGARYSYMKQSFSSIMNKPVVFPGSGQKDIDCGFGDATDVGEITTFCEMEDMPFKEYDIECTVK